MKRLRPRESRRSELDDVFAPREREHVDRITRSQVTTLHERGARPHRNERTRGATRSREVVHAERRQRRGLVCVCGHDRGKRHQRATQRIEARNVDERAASTRRQANGVDDENELRMRTRETCDRANVGRAAERSSLERAHALVRDHFAGLSDHQRGRDGVLFDEAGRGLHGDRREHRTRERTHGSHRPHVGRDPRAAAGVQTRHDEHAYGRMQSHARSMGRLHDLTSLRQVFGAWKEDGPVAM